MPAALVEPLKGQLSYSRVVFGRDRAGRRRRGTSLRLGAQVSECRPRVAVALDLPHGPHLDQSPLTHPASALNVSTTMIYTHVLNRGGRGVVSPLDQAMPGRSERACQE